jgi:hypothetical protein
MFIYAESLPMDMGFSKTFPRNVKGSAYPVWEEMFLTDREEAEAEEHARAENIRVMRECLKDADRIMAESGLKRFQTSLMQVAVALFEKRASHAVYYKENAAKAKFDELYRNKN